MPKKLLIALILLSIGIIAMAFIGINGARTGIIDINVDEIGSFNSLAGDTGTISEIGSLASYQYPFVNNNEGNVTLYGGEKILVILGNDPGAFEDEAKRRLGELGKFKRYKIRGQETVYLDVNKTILKLDQNENSALILLASNNEEIRKGTGNYPHSIMLDSNENMFIEDIIEVLFDGGVYFVYIPRDHNVYDNSPVPKAIVEKQKGTAVQYIRAGGFDYIAFGFGTSADFNMMEMIKRNGVYQGGGGGASGNGPVFPIPEQNPFILTSVGLIGLLLVLKMYKKN